MKQVDVDDMKFQLYGPDARDEELSRADWVRIYDEMYKLIQRHLRAGKSVVDGSGHFRRSERQAVRELARQLGLEAVTIYVVTPEAVARQRLLRNRTNSSRLDVTDDDFDHILRVWEPPDAEEHPLLFRHSDELDGWITAHASLIGPT